MKHLIGALALAAFAVPALADEERAKIRIELQASMQRHIDRATVEGAFLNIDLASGDVQKYFPSKAHSVVLRGDGYYVMCSDMKSETGKSVPVDYYMIRDRRGYKVFRTEIANRKPLQSLMKSGEVQKY